MADEAGNQEQALSPAEAGPSHQAQQNAIASPDEGAERPAKRQRVEEQELDYSYEPSELCDVIVKCGDGKRIGLHRAFILRQVIPHNSIYIVVILL